MESVNTGIRRVRNIIVLVFVFSSACGIAQDVAHPQEIPRTILALYKSRDTTSGLRYHPLHRFLEMPLNHLGLKVMYWDIEQGLPDLSKMPPLRGMVSWFYRDEMNTPELYLNWAIEQMQQGRKFLVIQNIGAYENVEKERVSPHWINEFLSFFQLRHNGRWMPIDPTVELHVTDENMVHFEDKSYFHPKGVDGYELLSGKLTPLIAVEINHYKTPVGMLSQFGGIFQENYFIRTDNKTGLARWFVNPFAVLQKVFNTSDLPKPDITTQCGKRLYFSHIDGDGWQRKSQIYHYAKQGKTCAEVIYENAIAPFKHLPVTVAPIAADLDPEWVGTSESQDIARKIFNEPQVQAASNTYSHPMAWDYYAEDDAALKEQKEFSQKGKDKTESVDLLSSYMRPRLYMSKPFDLEKELLGSCDYIQKFLPPGKKVELIQWSGNCMPFGRALAVLGSSPFYNLNGGDSRFDHDFPSYSSVCPVGRDVEGHIQVYAANSNESTYTDGWTKNFFAFQFLKNTFMRTESPLRIKPINLYYHIYSGEKVSSLMALLSNLDYINKSDVAPLKTVDFAKIGRGFFTTRLVAEGQLKWRVLDRQALQTIRFDQASDQSVDFEASEGVIGERHFQGSLYIALDGSVASPLIALKRGDVYAGPPDPEKNPYLLSSRWAVQDVAFAGDDFTFTAEGYGHMDMSWVMPEGGDFRVTALDTNGISKIVNVGEEGQLKIDFFFTAASPMKFSVSKVRAT